MISLGKIAIVGSGAIGTYYGALLAESGQEVHFLMRSDLEHAKKHGIIAKSKDREIHIAKPQVAGSTQEIGSCDLVIIAMKSTANDQLIALLPPLVTPETLLLTLQNGLGQEALLAQHFGGERVLGGLCFVCLNRIAPAVVQNFGHGEIRLGEYVGEAQPRTQRIGEAFRAAGITCTVVNRLEEERWRKLVWNIPFNGLTVAAGGIDVEQVMRDPHLRGEAEELMREVVAIAARCDVAIGEDFIRLQMDRTEVMGPYLPSSLIDFRAGRPVEVASIWGEPLRAAERLGVKTPRLAMLHALLHKVTSARARA